MYGSECIPKGRALATRDSGTSSTWRHLGNSLGDRSILARNAPRRSTHGAKHRRRREVCLPDRKQRQCNKGQILVTAIVTCRRVRKPGTDEWRTTLKHDAVRGERCRTSHEECDAGPVWSGAVRCGPVRTAPWISIGGRKNVTKSYTALHRGPPHSQPQPQTPPPQPQIPTSSGGTAATQC